MLFLNKENIFYKLISEKKNYEKRKDPNYPFSLKIINQQRNVQPKEKTPRELPLLISQSANTLGRKARSTKLDFN